MNDHYGWLPRADSEEKLGVQINRGHRADNEMLLLGEAFETLESQYTQAWKEAALRDVDGRERLWQAVQIVGKVRRHLSDVAANGRVAQKVLDRLRTGKTGLFS